MAKNYYETLGVSRDATPEEIKKSYRKSARKYHPDVSKEPDAEAQMQALNIAYDTLSDAEKKQSTISNLIILKAFPVLGKVLKAVQVLMVDHFTGKIRALTLVVLKTYSVVLVQGLVVPITNISVRRTAFVVKINMHESR